MTDRKKFRRWLSELRRKFPSAIPVRVYLVKPSKIPGLCGESDPISDPETGDTKRVVIRIADNLSKQATADTLAEEWAHALRFHLKLDAGPNGHDEIYGAIFNKLKEKWLHDDDGEG